MPRWLRPLLCAAPAAPCATKPATPLAMSRPMTPYAKSSLQPRQIRRERLEIVLRCGVHEVRHAGIVAAPAGAEIHHAFQNVLSILSCEARLGSFALVTGLMAARASDRGVGAQSPCRDRVERAGLAQIGPGFLREIKRDRQHFVALQLLRDRPHHVALAGAALEVAQLQIKIALVLAPDHRPRLVGRNAVFAVAGRAGLHLVLDRLGDREWSRRERRNHTAL